MYSNFLGIRTLAASGPSSSTTAPTILLKQGTKPPAHEASQAAVMAPLDPSQLLPAAGSAASSSASGLSSPLTNEAQWVKSELCKQTNGQPSHSSPRDLMLKILKREIEILQGLKFNLVIDELFQQHPGLLTPSEIQSSLGVMYEFGKGVEKNKTTASKWYQKAETDSTAQYRLGMMYKYGHEGLKNDLTKAIGLTELAANQGHVGAQNYVGRMYYELARALRGKQHQAQAQGLKKQAADYWKMATEQGHINAYDQLKNKRLTGEDYTSSFIKCKNNKPLSGHVRKWQYSGHVAKWQYKTNSTGDSGVIANLVYLGELPVEIIYREAALANIDLLKYTGPNQSQQHSQSQPAALPDSSRSSPSVAGLPSTQAPAVPAYSSGLSSLVAGLPSTQAPAVPASSSGLSSLVARLPSTQAPAVPAYSSGLSSLVAGLPSTTAPAVPVSSSGLSSLVAGLPSSSSTTAPTNVLQHGIKRAEHQASEHQASDPQASQKRRRTERLVEPPNPKAPPQGRACPPSLIPVFPMGTVPQPMGVFPMAARAQVSQQVTVYPQIHTCTNTEQWPTAFSSLAPTQPTTQPSEKVPEVVQESLTIAILDIVKDPDGLSWLIQPANIHNLENLLQSACSNNYSPACRENLSFIIYALSNDPYGLSWLKEPNNACMVKKVLGLLTNDDNTFTCQDIVACVQNKLDVIGKNSKGKWIAKL